MGEPRTFVIVGAGLTGAKAAQTLREEGFDGDIVLLGEEPDRPYERPATSASGSSSRSGRVADASWPA